jgi:hypothetical protein
VHGSSDKHAAFPASHAVDPVDIHATIYHLMGLGPQTTIFRDRLGRPSALCTGNVIRAIL